MSLSKNKFFILFLVFLILFISSTFCFATEYNYSIGLGSDNLAGYRVSNFNDIVKLAKNDERVVSGAYYYFVSYNYGDRTINSVLVKKDSHNFNKGFLNSSFWNESGYFHYVLNPCSEDLTSNDIIYLSGRNALKNANSDYFGLSVCSDANGVFYLDTNFDKNIYCDDTFQQIFFQGAPQEITQTLVGAASKAQIQQTIQTMITGFLKYLLALVISVIAFYKGWKFLSTQLRKS